MAEHLICEIPKNSREAIRVTLGEYSNGRSIASVRAWFQAEDGSWRPGKAGIAFRVALLPRLAEALARVVSEARQQGLIPGAGDDQ
jgi:Transcriptional Coactivator p15 (PC4)